MGKPKNIKYYKRQCLCHYSFSLSFVPIPQVDIPRAPSLGLLLDDVSCYTADITITLTTTLTTSHPHTHHHTCTITPSHIHPHTYTLTHTPSHIHPHTHTLTHTLLTHTPPPLQVHFDRYNQKFAGDGMHDPLDWTEYDDPIEQFKRDHIHQTIIDTEIMQLSYP